MKIRMLFVAVVALCLASSASAQDSDVYGDGLDLSVYATYMNAKDGDDNAWGPGLGLSVPLYENILKFDARISWLPDVGAEGPGDLELAPLDLGLSVHQWVGPDCNIDLYAMGGATYVFADYDGNRYVSDIDSGWGAYAGAGAAYMFSENLGLFTNVYYRFISLDTKVADSFAHDGGDFDADGINLDIGMKWAF